ncbi:DUF747-domain-containing protein [Hortaea werneckii]|uniref:DUF747-domain-containing protein n=1 Tax=Hortaea werneckii TaxID=91943 RepID=A0A3M7GHC8_HORWE|nr:DUF747-domain-containing protein [Hortaea werneckii]KAI7354593.1 DUF747-domain-containing protein [Hortaea werneckii]KAI7567949.1 DUF747-domain-containing protein [Hortaea werneckii]KAI7622887.1 DUF747-domain-containing protein [Hortaea werneckii]KAI7636257.1 DUF747-domain-containing protein [Hortaea werneckii]
MDEGATSSAHESLRAVPAANGQLVTPALSPISEHGENKVHPFPDWNNTAHNERQEDTGTRERAITEHVDAHDTSDSQAHVAGEADHVRKRSSTGPKSPRLQDSEAHRLLKLSPRQIHDLVTSPDSLPIRPVSPPLEDIPQLPNGLGINEGTDAPNTSRNVSKGNGQDGAILHDGRPSLPSVSATPGAATGQTRPAKAARSASSPLLNRKPSSSRSGKPRPDLTPLKTGNNESATLPAIKPSPKLDSQPSPIPAIMPIPPLSLPTYLQLELSSHRPSPLYLHRSASSDVTYESSAVKLERLYNFFCLPWFLEQILWFGAVSCLDAWLYTFTILPLRFLKALAILAQSWGQNAVKELRSLWNYVYGGVGRLWQRSRNESISTQRQPSEVAAEQPPRNPAVDAHARVPRSPKQALAPLISRRHRKSSAGLRHRRSRSTPSALLPNHKADILQGLLIITTCIFLMRFDASRMYHFVRGQSAIKLYVIYNVLEVFDRLFSAIGQDILECLFSKETLERNEEGRSKVSQPLWMFLGALVYNVLHSTALFFQVVTLNVAVNSYSNALLTLLMSNQFVEIKGTVFKKFEKEALFQITCADIVERFQLWLMLLIIALRNIVEVGGLSISINTAFADTGSTTDTYSANTTHLPLLAGFAVPKAFTLVPKFCGEVLGPFLIVLGSEALVDWIKHCYINKFNNIKPKVYGRFLDVLAKDYYSHAFADQNLTKRFGLPVIPLSCLFIRACIQTYHMFLATHVPIPIPSVATAVSVENEAAATSPATKAALQHIDQVFRRAIGRSSFGAGADPTSAFSWWSIDDVIALATMIIFFLALYLVLLACKLLLGMLLLSCARSRYKGMKERERMVTGTEGRRAGGWGVVEISDDKRRWIYDDDPDGLQELREKEERGRKQNRSDKGDRLDGVDRYMMASKRIW